MAVLGAISKLNPLKKIEDDDGPLLQEEHFLAIPLNNVPSQGPSRSSANTQTSGANNAYYSSLPRENVTNIDAGAAFSRNSKLTTLGRETPMQQNSLLYHTKAWAAEALWCVLSILCLIAMVILLSQYNDRPMPEWPLGLTLNTVVAVLATLCRFMTVIPVGEGLSQLKWNHFANRKEPIENLYYFDQASRGPLGSFALVYKMRGRFLSFATLASIVMISGLVTSFLTQSTITYQTVDVTRKVGQGETGATAPVAHKFPSESFLIGSASYSSAGTTTIEGMAQAAYQAAFYPLTQRWPEPELHCESSKCKWPSFSSLAICASMKNVTDRLSFEEVTKVSDYYYEGHNATLPDNIAHLVLYNASAEALSITYGNWERNSTNGTVYWPHKRKNVANWSNPDILPATILQFYMIYGNRMMARPRNFRALEINLHFCVNTYRGEAATGRSTTSLVSSAIKIDKVTNINTVYGNENEFNTFTMLSEDGEESFTVAASLAYEFLGDKFSNTFSGEQYPNVKGADLATFPYQFYTNLYKGVEDQYRGTREALITGEEKPPEDNRFSAVEIDNKTWTNVEAMVNNVADAMASFMRYESGNVTTAGQNIESETHVVVRWEWITFLAAQISLSIIFLIAVIINTARAETPVVKSSNIAELCAFIGSEDFKKPHTGLIDYRGIDTQVQGCTTAELLHERQGWRLEVSR